MTTPHPTKSAPAPSVTYTELPDFDTVEQRIYAGCRRFISVDMLEPIHNLIRDAIDADRAMRAQAAPAAVAGPVDDLAELSLLNRLIDLGNKAAGAHAASNSDDGHKGTAAYVQWQELRSQMGDLIRAAYAEPTTLAAPKSAPVAQGDARAEQALLKVLTAVQRYLQPDGPSAKDTLAEIIGIIDPWPLGDQKGKA